MTCLLQVSDPHFGTERPEVVRALERFSRSRQPDVLVLSGDITQRATRAQFTAAKRFVERLAIPDVLAIPGNHDIPLFALPTRMFDPYGRYREAFGTELEPVIDRPGCLVIGVNATRWYRHENGVVSAAQVERVAQRLAQADDASLRIVVVHQPVAVTRNEDIANLLIGREAALRAWSAAGADLILGGHIHLPFLVPMHRVMDGIARQLWCVQAGTAVSTRIRAGAPNSVNLIRRDANARTQRCVVERWDYAAASDSFERRETLGILLTRARAETTALAA